MEQDRYWSIAEIPAVREEPTAEDPHDGVRLKLLHSYWSSQDEALRRRDRQVEENVRMLAGQQWTVWSDVLGRFIDITRFMTDDEKRWRQRPVINRLLYWYILTHARLTENPPIVTFRPGPDRVDAMLAEVMDTVFKSVWNETGMTEAVDRLMAWLIPGGEAYLLSRVDRTKGELREYVGPAMLSMQGADGGMIERLAEAVPYDAGGAPLAELTPDGTGYSLTGQPHQEREGELVIDVLSPLECRGEWGPKPWHQKRWHEQVSFLTPEEVYETWGVWVEPDTFGDQDAAGYGELQRMLFGSGYYGAAGNKAGSEFSTAHKNQEGFVRVTTLWMAPSPVVPGMEETEESPGGRLLIGTKAKVLWDSVRPARFKYTSPIRCFRFVNLPGRPSGTTPQEALNPLQQTYNRGAAQILEHRNLVTNPKAIIDKQAGISEEQITNKPGEKLFVTMRSGVVPYSYVAPPALSSDVWRTQEWLKAEQQDLGAIEGSEGRAPTRNAPAELVRELRFNSDRFLGPTLRRAVEEMARMVEDWIAILPTIWDQEKVIAYAGEDSVVRTVTVLPMMFEQGKVNVVPDLESMLPEGRGERQQRAFAMYEAGLFGQPGDPEAVRHYLDIARFPHLNRAVKPGGIHRVTAEQENGRLVQGEQAQAIAVLEWYNHEIHLAVHEEFMSSPEYLKLNPAIQQQFVIHRLFHQMAQAVLLEQAMALQGAAQTMALESGAVPDSETAQPESAASEERRPESTEGEQYPTETAVA
jgi:hypothetical protein